jgi:CDP-glycerol glycerophosphotransferase (TagB/SpsB family)
LQTEIPAPMIVYHQEVYDHIQKNYPTYADRTLLISSRKEVKAHLTKEKIRVAIYPAFTTTRCCVEVQIFHGGLSDKTFIESPFLSIYDLVLFPGQKSVDKVKKAKLLDKVIDWDIIGYPKFDPLINKNLSYHKCFNNNKPTILYAPTWISSTRPNSTNIQHRFSPHGESSLPLWGLEIVKQIPGEYNLIVKFHSKIFDDGDLIHKAMTNYVEKHNLSKNVVILYDDNILPYMDQSDIMISDISSACYEWFHFDRPIIFANPSPENYKPENDISKNTYAWQAGDVLYHPEDILPILQRNLQVDSYQEKRNEILNYSIFSPDGHATQRQAKKILQLYKQSQKLPYWLFSITMICKHIYRRYKLKALAIKSPLTPK